MRTSPRRRVMPRALSSLASGNACLRVVAQASRNWAMVNPAGSAASRTGGGTGGDVDGGGVEPLPDPLDQHTPAGQLPQFGPRHPLRGPAGPCRRRPGGPTTGWSASTSTAPAARARLPSTATPSSVRSSARSRSSRGPVSRPSGPAAPILARRSSRAAGEGGGRHDPVADVRVRGGRRSAARARRRRPTPFGDDPVDVRWGRAARPAARARRRGSRPRRPSRPAALAQHVPVARAQREADRQVQADHARARGDRVGPEHPQAHGVLARAEVGEVGAPARHVVVERPQHPGGPRRPRGDVPARRAPPRDPGERRRGRPRPGSGRRGCPVRSSRGRARGTAGPAPAPIARPEVRPRR